MKKIPFRIKTEVEDIDGQKRLVSTVCAAYWTGRRLKNYQSMVVPINEYGRPDFSIKLACIETPGGMEAKRTHENLHKLFEKGYYMGPEWPVIQF